MGFIRLENNDSRLTITDHKPIGDFMIDIHRLENFLSKDAFDGILWDNQGLLKVLTRGVLQEGVDTYNATRQNPRGPVASHVGVFLWEQTISRQEANQRGKASSSESPGPENKPDQGPLES